MVNPVGRLLASSLWRAGRRALTVQIVVALLVTVLATLWLERPGRHDTSALARAEAMQQKGNLGGAERLLWTSLSEGVTVPLLLAFLDNHHHQRVLTESGPTLRSNDAFLVAEVEIDALFSRIDLTEDVQLLGLFWRAALQKQVPETLRQRVVALAAREPPTPFANHLLGNEARRNGRLIEAATRLEREGLHFPERADDFRLAMRILVMAELWDEIGERMKNPAVAPHMPPALRYGYAVRTKDVRGAVRAIVEIALERRPAAALAMAAISGAMWLLFLLRLGRVREQLSSRLPLFLAAFVLGIVSVLPTLVVVGLEESLLGFRERGELVSDFIFFTVGVGLREELCKLLLFLSLLPILRARGNRLEVLACGALVGLGFATEENVQYLQHGGLTTGLSRFLTANFLHMALSGLLALAAFDALRDQRGDTPTFSRTLLTVTALHGAYDLFLSSRDLDGLGFLSMTIFIILTRLFLREVAAAARGPTPGLLRQFARAVVVVACASFVYASSFVGPAGAALALAQGMLGLVLIVGLFVQEMRAA